MAAFNFPPSPSNGDTYTLNSVTYQYDGTKWVRYSASVGAQGAQGHQGATGSTGAQGALATINSNTNNYVLTATGTANTIQGESNLRFNGSSFAIGGHDPQKRFHVREDNNSLHHIAYLQNRYSGNTSSSLIAMSCGTVDFSDNKYAHMGAVISGVNENGTNLIFGTNEHNGSVQTRLTIRPDGKIGISEGNPDTQLHISGNANAQTTAGAGINAIRITDTDTSAQSGQVYGEIQFETLDATSAGVAAFITAQGNSSGAAALKFGTGSGGSATTKMVIHQTGNASLGTEVPNEYSNQTTFTINGSTYGRLDLEVAGTLKGSVWANTGGLGLDAGGNDMEFFTGSSQRLKITTDGRFGFNTTPTVANEYLHIKPVGNNVLDIRYELNSSTDIRHKFYDDAGVWRGGFNYTTYANSTAYPNFHDSYYFLVDPSSNGTLDVALRVTNTGQFIKPLTYQFLVETNGVSVSGGWTKLTGLSIDSTHSTGVSNGTYWSNSNQRFTAPVTGTYNFFIGGFSPTADGGSTTRYMYTFVINGGNYNYGMGGNYSAGNTPMAGGSIYYKLSVNDYVEVYYYSAISATWGAGHRFFWGGYFVG